MEMKREEFLVLSLYEMYKMEDNFQFSVLTLILDEDCRMWDMWAYTYNIAWASYDIWYLASLTSSSSPHYAEYIIDWRSKQNEEVSFISLPLNTKNSCILCSPKNIVYIQLPINQKYIIISLIFCVYIWESNWIDVKGLDLKTLLPPVLMRLSNFSYLWGRS